jgi:hypothetical protein
MGSEFIRRAAASFRKSWDRGRVALGTADLFTCLPACAARSAAFDITGNAKLEPGGRVTVEPEGGGLVARRGLVEVARNMNPSAELLRAVHASCGVAKGTIEQVHHLADVAEISLC